MNICIDKIDKYIDKYYKDYKEERELRYTIAYSLCFIIFGFSYFTTEGIVESLTGLIFFLCTVSAIATFFIVYFKDKLNKKYVLVKTEIDVLHDDTINIIDTSKLEETHVNSLTDILIYVKNSGNTLIKDIEILRKNNENNVFNKRIHESVNRLESIKDDYRFIIDRTVELNNSSKTNSNYVKSMLELINGRFPDDKIFNIISKY